MRRVSVMLLLCQVLLSFGQAVYAEGYEECKENCSKESSDCMGQVSAFAAIDAGLMAEKDAECRQKLEACHAGCNAIPQQKETPEEVAPPSPPEE